MMDGIFSGLDIEVAPDVPKMQLSADCPVTPEFRAEMNAWLRDFFGVDSVVPDGKLRRVYDVPVGGFACGKPKFLVNPRTYAVLRAQSVALEIDYVMGMQSIATAFSR